MLTQTPYNDQVCRAMRRDIPATEVAGMSAWISEPRILNTAVFTDPEMAAQVAEFPFHQALAGPCAPDPCDI